MRQRGITTVILAGCTSAQPAPIARTIPAVAPLPPSASCSSAGAIATPTTSKKDDGANEALRRLYPGVGWWCWGAKPTHQRCWRTDAECQQHREKRLNKTDEGPPPSKVSCEQTDSAWCYAVAIEGEFADGSCLSTQETCDREVDVWGHVKAMKKTPRAVSTCIELP